MTEPVFDQGNGNGDRYTDPDRSDAAEPITGKLVPTMLKALLREQNWNSYVLFKRAYQKAAGKLDRELVDSCPSERTLKRWQSGRSGTPRAEHCVVLEEMFPEWSAKELLAPQILHDDDPEALLLKVLLKDRHLHTHRAFCKAYDEVARRVNSVWIGSHPSQRQFYRWISGDMIGLPYPNNCNILEAMFPGYTAEQLFSLAQAPATRSGRSVVPTRIAATYSPSSGSDEEGTVGPAGRTVRATEGDAGMIEPTRRDSRRCADCGTMLASDNTARLCGRCRREQSDQLALPPAHLRNDFFETDEFRSAFESQHIGRVFKAYRNHPRHLQLFGKALNQELLGRWLGLNQAQVSKLENGKPEENLKVLRNYAEILHLPQHMLWFDFPGQRRWKSPGAAVATETGFTPSSQEADRLLAQVLGSSTSGDAINQLAYATASLAESHTQAPARHVLTQVLHLHEQAQILLGAKQRLSQQRELYRIESDLLSHACLLLDDLKQNGVAQKYGTAALSFAKEGGTGQATARTALAKALRWADRLIESADMAKIGYECSPSTPIRIQLASQEANAAALMGNISRAREALKRADVAAETIAADSGTSAWSFPIGRQAIFALSVALQSGDADTALDAVARADVSWKSGTPLVTANWAQIRIGAGMAHLLKGSLDATIDEVTPVLALSPELRISTITSYMQQLDRRLCDPQFSGNSDVAELRQNILEFNSVALSATHLPGSE